MVKVDEYIKVYVPKDADYKNDPSGAEYWFSSKKKTGGVNRPIKPNNINVPLPEKGTVVINGELYKVRRVGIVGYREGSITILYKLKKSGKFLEFSSKRD